MDEHPIPNDWTGEYCCFSVLWPNSPQYLAILRGLFVSAAGGRFYVADTGSIVTAQQTIRYTWDYNFQHREVIMSCDNGELAAALQNIATALQSSGGSTAGCCGGSTAGGGQFPAAPGGVDTGGSDPDTDPPPTGFDSWEAYELQRCGEAHEIIDDIKLSLAHLQLLLVGGLSVEGVVELLLVAFTLTISSAGIAAIAALVVTIGAVVIAATALSIVNDNTDDLICALLSGHDSVSSRDAFIDVFGGLVDDAEIDVVEGFLIKQLMGYMLEIGETNKMYIPNPAIDYTSFTCPDCTEPCFLFDSDLEGFTADNPPGIGVMLGEPTISWADGEMILTSDEDIGSGLSYGGALSPTFSHVIETGDSLCTSVTAITSGSYNSYGYVLIDDVWIDLGSASGTETPRDNETSLEPYVGQTITRYFFSWSRFGSFTVNVAETGVNCPACLD